MITIFADVFVFDGLESEFTGPAHIVVEGDRIREVSLQRPAFRDAVVLSCSGRYLMPGLIDAHFHAYSPSTLFRPW